MNTSQKGDNESKEDETVFIIDDEEGMVVFLEDCLDGHYTVKSDTDAIRAFHRIDNSVDVVLLDRKMPEMTGDKLLGLLREKGLDVQIAMITAIKPTEEIMEMPFDDYLVKPVEEPEVLGLVDTLITRKQFRRATQRFFRNISKIQALEKANRTDTKEYDKLIKRTAELHGKINEILDNINSPNFS
ncbi:response regulator [Haloarcula sp. H-GB5]